MEAPFLPKRVYRFGLFQVDSENGKLLRQGVPVKLQEQPFRVLCLLLERPGQIVTREELQQSLWPHGTYVEFDGSLNAALKRLRFALGDDADNPVFIETVSRRGYRFIAPLERVQIEIGAAPKSHPPDAEQPSSQSIVSSPRRTWLLRWWAWAALAAAAVVAISLGWRSATRTARHPVPNVKVIAVLPFVNEGAGPDFDYLRYALPNDLITDLTYARSISVRPFASTSRYTSQSIDLAAVGKELRVSHILTGGFLLGQQLLHVNLELVDVEQNEPVWRGEVTVLPQQLVGLHDQLATGTVQGLLAAMNVSRASTNEIPVPRNAEAFELFLHSLSFPLDPEPNRVAVGKLEESVSIDSKYAPAWGELANRYYFDYHYANGGDTAIAKALTAYKRQADLDPDVPSVPTVIRVEQGDLNGAYDQALELVRRRPDLSAAHFGLSYVLRYAGLLEEAGVQCDAALALDPGFTGLRSCANPFIQKGEYEHATKYISLDAKFPYSRLAVQLRTQNTTPILPELTDAVQSGFRGASIQLAFFRACLDPAAKGDLSKAAEEIENMPLWAHDGEPSFADAEFLAFCGQADGAMKKLATAIKRRYCSYPAMDKDPIFDTIRSHPRFAELRHDAIECQESFQAYRRQMDGAAQLNTRKTD